MINKLSTAQATKAFINYRDSKITRILQPALGGNSKTAIICTMTQTFANYQETVNTLLFGQKAKHVKTTVNLNELSSLSQSPELEQAHKDISQLKRKLKEYERLISKLKTDEQENKKLGESVISTTKDKMLAEQLDFLQGRITAMQRELEEKEATIQLIEQEKGEYARKFETLEFENTELQQKVGQLTAQNEDYQKSLEKADELIKTLEERLGKYSGKKSEANMEQDELEADGIKLLSLDQSGELYRASHGADD